jgi:hypothetical protein
MQVNVKKVFNNFFWIVIFKELRDVKGHLTNIVPFLYYKSWFFIREIDKKGPKSDTSQFDQGAILNKSILTMSSLSNGFFLLTIPCHFD